MSNLLEVQHYDDLELPSLPSFHPDDIDFDSDRSEDLSGIFASNGIKAHYDHLTGQPSKEMDLMERSEVLDMKSPGKISNQQSLERPYKSNALPQTPSAVLPNMETPRAGLRDVTTTFQNRPPHTPSPASMLMSDHNEKTPRAPLNDAERRKSHIIAVLTSESKPPRAKGRSTPHPLRRVSTMPLTESTVEDEEAPIATSSNFTVEGSEAFDESFVSIASSADLTSDRRATKLHSFTRGNTSFPNILLPTSSSSAIPGAPPNVGVEQRADGIKINKHLNAMNKQLLDSNAELAREAEAWRDECSRLMSVLREAGIDLDVDRTGLSMSQSEHSAASHDSLELPTMDYSEQQTLETDNELAKQQQENDAFIALQHELDAARSSLAKKEQEIEELRNKDEVAPLAKSMSVIDKSVFDQSLVPNPAIVSALEERLDEAYREIGRLKHESEASRARKATIEIQDTRIKALEAERDALLERVDARGNESPSGEWASPRLSSSPYLHKAITSLRTPMTPGPIKDLSWLQTTIGDANEPILRAQIEHLQHEIDLANSQLDKNFGRLEQAGFGSLALAEKLAAAQDRISQLEDEVRKLMQENKSSLTSLGAGRTSNERLELALQAVHEQMASLKADLDAEKGRLQRDNISLRGVIDKVKTDSDREIQTLGLEMAKIIEEAETKASQNHNHINKLGEEKMNLEAHLRSRTATIERLEKEMHSLREVSRKKDSSEEITRLQLDIETLQLSLRDAQSVSDCLRDTINQRTKALNIAERRSSALEAERQRVTREIVQFSEDLSVQRRESAKFGAELKLLRQEQIDAKANQVKELNRLHEELRWAKDKLTSTTKEAKEAQQTNANVMARLLDPNSNGASMAEQRQKFKAQTRGLSAHIQYLKAKYTREATFRNALSLQKRFLLLLVGGMSLNEQATLRAIVSMGYAIPQPPRPKRTMKGVAIAILGVIRARRLAEQWRKANEFKSSAQTVFKDQR